MCRELLFLARLDVGDVGADDSLGIAHPLHRPESSHSASSQNRSTSPSECVTSRIVLPAALELGELVETLVREALVAHRQDFVDQQDIGIDMDRDGESQPHVHPGRVGLHRRVDELLELGEFDNLVEALGHFALRQAEHDAVDEHVLAAGDFRVKPCAQFDQRGDAAADFEVARGWLGNACDELQHCALPGTVATDHSQRSTGWDRERDVTHGGERLVRLQIADQASRQ